MGRKSLIIAGIAIAAVSATMGVALAEPARTVEVGGGKPTSVTWDGNGSGILATQDAMDAAGCQPGIHECDDTLIHVLEAGTLTVKTSSDDPGAIDTDLQLFVSDSTGKVGAEVQESAQAAPTPVEEVSAKVKAGYYIARIDYAIGSGVVKGEAILKPSGGTTPAPTSTPGGGPPTTDTPPSVTLAKPRSTKRLKAFSGTASDDKGVAKVEVGLLYVKSKKACYELVSTSGKTKKSQRCTQPSKFFVAKGTTNWKFSLSKALKKGTYRVFVRATDTAGQTQGGFGSANMRTVKAK